jgi:hypothetical protein
VVRTRSPAYEGPINPAEGSDRPIPRVAEDPGYRSPPALRGAGLPELAGFAGPRLAGRRRSPPRRGWPWISTPGHRLPLLPPSLTENDRSDPFRFGRPRLSRSCVERVGARKGRGRAEPRFRYLPKPSKDCRSAGTAPVAQLDRALVYETRGHRFESCRARPGLSRVRTCDIARLPGSLRFESCRARPGLSRVRHPVPSGTAVCDGGTLVPQLSRADGSESTWAATSARISRPWRSRNAGPIPWIRARASIPAGREAAIASRVRLCATV